MKNQINIEELFKSKLENLEAAPKANAWASIQSGLSTSAAATTTASTSWLTTAIVAGSITLVSIGGFFYFNAQGEKSKSKNSKAIEVVSTEVISTEKAIQEELIEEEKGITVTEITEVENSSANENISTSKATTTNNNKSITYNSAKEEPIRVSNKTIDEIIAEHQAELELNSEDNNVAKDTKAEEIYSLESSEENKEDATADKSSVLKGKDSNTTNSNEIKELIMNKTLFPNVFSPNADGKNDFFVFNPEKNEKIDQLVEKLEVRIFSKTGKLVGQWLGKLGNWDGRLPNGSLAPAGQYSYMAIIYIEGKGYPKKGGFTIFD